MSNLCYVWKFGGRGEQRGVKGRRVEGNGYHLAYLDKLSKGEENN